MHGSTRHGLSRRRLLTGAGAVVAGVAAAGLPAGPASAAVNDAHLLIGTHGTFADSLGHKLRDPSGVWSPSPEWGDVNGAAGGFSPAFNDIGAARVNDELHLINVADDAIHHTLRNSAGGWSPLTNPSGFGAGPQTFVKKVAAAGAGRGGRHLHTVITTMSEVLHSERNVDTGGWTPWAVVPKHVFYYDDVAAAGGADGYFHLFGLASNDELWHGVRDPNTGEWSAPGSPAKVPGAIAVAAGRAGSEVHVAVLTGDAVWHQIRRLDGTWTSMNLLENISGAVDIGAAGTPNGEFQVTVVGGSRVRHRLRRASSAWTNFVTLDTNPASRVAMAG